MAGNKQSAYFVVSVDLPTRDLAMSNLFSSSSILALAFNGVLLTVKPIALTTAALAVSQTAHVVTPGLSGLAYGQEDPEDDFDEDAEDDDDFDGEDPDTEDFDSADFDVEDFEGEAEEDFNNGEDEGADDEDYDDDNDDDRDEDDDDVRLDPDEIEFEAATGIDPDDFEYDEMGFPARSNEVLAFDLGDDELAIARDLGFELIERRELIALGGSVDRLKVPEDFSLPGAVDALDSAMPAAPFDYNHIYLLPEGEADENQVGQNTSIGQPRVGEGIRLGIIDTLVDTSHPSFLDQSVTVRDFAGDGGRDTEHGTAVASILVGKDPDQSYSGLIPGAEVFAANVFTIGDTGLPSTNTFAMVEALDWVASQGVGVISISIAGPDSAIIAEAITRVHARGQVVVAAVGNDGPAAPPLFPASYEGVVGVTAIDTNQRVFRRAGRGDHVDFSAPGVRVRAAAGEGRYALMSGTSFATPVIAALIALRIEREPSQVDRVLLEVSRSVRDLGSPGKDPIFGYGLLVVGDET